MDGFGRRGRLIWMTLLVVISLVVMGAGGCGGSDPATESTALGATSTLTDSSEPTGDSEGVLVAKEILATFDELVAEVAELASDLPDAAVLKPQLEELYTSYEPTMNELNTKYLALRDSDIAQFGECNGYLGEYRGKHVFDKDVVLTEALTYYNLELGDQEMVHLLSKRPVELLDIAVNQG